MSSERTSSRAFAIIFLLILGATIFAGAQLETPSTTILHNAHLVTPEGALEETALVLRQSTIVALTDEDGIAAWRDEKTTLVDLKGATVIPGLRDAHGHLYNLGKQNEILDLREAEDLSDVVNRVESALVTFKGTWFLGRGWDQSLWQGDQRLPQSLDQIDPYTGDTPVFLKRVGGHSAWVNSKALEIAGIDRDTPNPEGGRIVKNAEGELTGLLLDKAKSLVERHLPKLTPKVLDRRLRKALNKAAAMGLVAVHDAGMSRAELEALFRIAAEGPLPVRVYVMLSAKDESFLSEQFALGPRIGLYDDHITIRSVKLVQDGAMGSRGALLLAPYSDEPTTSGLPVNSQQSTLRIAKKSVDAGFQVATHAIGDRANQIVLNNYGELFMEADYQKLRAARLRVEHAQVVTVEDLPRFAQMGVIASMQPTHATSDMRWVKDRLGYGRLGGAYAWRTLEESGAVLAFGSDFPVELIDPRIGLYAAITRQDKEGHPEGGWRKHERLSAGRSLAGFTEGAAFAAFEEGERGRIAVGQRADLTILSADPLELARKDPKGLLTMQVLGTYVNGRKVTPLPIEE